MLQRYAQRLETSEILSIFRSELSFVLLKK